MHYFELNFINVKTKAHYKYFQYLLCGILYNCDEVIQWIMRVFPALLTQGHECGPQLLKTSEGFLLYENL